MKTGAGISRRQRLEMALTALLPAALLLLKGPIAAAGAGAWLCPLLALPGGWLLCRLWRECGPLFGDPGGQRWGLAAKIMAAAYLLWGVLALFCAAAGYSRRLISGLHGAGSRPLFLVATALLILWLSRSTPVFARASRLFFLTVALTLAAVLLLSLPGLDWTELRPPGTQGLAAGTLQILSLSGWVVFALFFPLSGPARGGQRAAEPRTALWAAAACGLLTALLAAVLGAFGPALPLAMDDPFLYLLSGVGLPGAFRRGEAALVTLAAVGDLTLLALLARACGELWGRLLPPLSRWGFLPAAVAFLAALLAPAEAAQALTAWALPACGLLFGAVLPLIAVLTKKVLEAKG